MRAVVWVVPALLAAACSSASTSTPKIASGGSPDPLRTPSPASTLLFPTHVLPANTMLASKAVFGSTTSLPWTFQSLATDGRSVVISYEPSNRCLHRNEAVLTRETTASVTITVVQRVIEDGTCPIAGRYLARVQLQAPLGTRQLLHGSLAP